MCATSNVTTWNPVRDKILKRALRIVHAYPAFGNPKPEELIDALDALNAMLKSWEADDLRWLNQDATLFLNEGQDLYYIGPTTYTGFSHCATSYVQTTLSADAESGDSSVELTSATGISSTDYIGICNDDGTIEWFTVTISGTTATLSSTLSGDCASGNLVYAHTTTSQINRPRKIDEARLKYYHSTASSGIEKPVEVISSADYNTYSDKAAEGKIVSVYYDPQLIAGRLSVWPTADYCGDKLILSVSRPIHDVVSSTETLDLPTEWMNAIVYNLADSIAPEYQLPISEQQLLMGRAQTSYNRILSFNREGSVYFEIGG